MFYIKYNPKELKNEIQMKYSNNYKFMNMKFYLLNNGKCGVAKVNNNNIFKVADVLDMIDFNNDNNETFNFMKLKVDSVIDDIKNVYLTYPTTKPDDDYSSLFPKKEIPDDEKEMYKGSIGQIINPKEDDGLSGGAIAGIVIGCVIGVLLILIVALCVFRRVKKVKHEKVSPIQNF